MGLSQLLRPPAPMALQLPMGPGNAYDGTGQPSAAYLSMSQGAVANANSTPPPYERTRLSPPRASYDDPYKKAVAMSKRYCMPPRLCPQLGLRARG